MITSGQIESAVAAPKTKSAVSSVCLDVVAASITPGALVDVYPCNGQANQQWSISQGAVVGTQSGLCLDRVDGTNRQLTMQTCSGAVTQFWEVR